MFEIATIADNWLHSEIVDEVMERIHEQDKIIVLAKTAAWAETRIRAISFIDDNDILKGIAKNEKDEDVQKALQKRINF